MRIFTLLASAALISSSAMAVPVIRHDGARQPIRNQVTLKSTRNVSLKQALRETRDSKDAIRFKAPAMKAPSTDMVEERPAGDVVQYAYNSDAYGVFWGYIIEAQAVNAASEFVMAPDGKVWLNNVQSQFPTSNYVYGTESAEGFTIPAGQCIYKEYDPENEEWLYAYPIALKEVTEEDEDGEYLTYVPTETGDYEFKLNGDHLVSADPEVVWGLCIWDEEAQEYGWVGYGDYNIEYFPVDDQLLTPPAGLATESWGCIGSNFAYMVNVGIENDNIWVQGLFEEMPEIWTQFKIDGENATFSGAQYMGVNTSVMTLCYACPGTIELLYDSDWDEYYEEPSLKDSITLHYDAEKKVLVTDEAIVFNARNDGEILYIDYINDFRITKQNRDINARPATPEITDIVPYLPDEELGYLYVNIPNVDVDGNILDGNKLSYEMFIDGETTPFEFTPEEYEMLSEPMTRLPWYFQDGYDIYASGASHTIYFYFDGVDKYGFKSYYVNEEGKTLESDYVEWDVTSIKGIDADKAVKSSVYYDLQGRRVANPDKGFYIRAIQYEDGTSANVKVAK